MSYQEALEAAGAEILVMKGFNDYQGSWYALVRYRGNIGWVSGSYGSCSHCDAFESEFGWNASDTPDYQERLARFGEEYLDELMTNEEVLKQASQNIKWDMDSKEVVEFINNK